MKCGERSGADGVCSGVGRNVDHFGHAVNPVAHDSLNTEFKGLRGRRAADACTGEFDFDDAGVFIHGVQDDVAPVGLEGGANHFNGCFNLRTHFAHHSISRGRTIHSVTFQPPGITALLAHQGGWDEVLLIGGPILAIAGLLILAKKRVDAAADESADIVD
jgi:hypothetical protein